MCLLNLGFWRNDAVFILVMECWISFYSKVPNQHIDSDFIQLHSVHNFYGQSFLARNRGCLVRWTQDLVSAFAAYMVLFTSNSNLQLTLGCFEAKRGASVMTISTSKAETMVLFWERVACPLVVGMRYSLRFKHLRNLFMSEGSWRLTDGLVQCQSLCGEES